MTLALAVHPDVQAALDAGRAVVALESTIITHGMPFPQNVDVARAVEATVRAAGAVPATIAILNGQLHIGLTDAQLMDLAQATDVAKVSRADFAAVLARGGYGATTVAATMIAAHLAGIHVFATGGIGGVHRGAEDSFDISADLQELAQTPVTVVCAGAKAILDLPKTFEVLETLGVPVFALGQDTLPAFWSRDGGLPAPLRADTPADVAKAAQTQRALGLQAGHLVCNPIPEDAEIPRAVILPMVDQALAEADDRAITGKAVTPFLLQRIYELTDGASLDANIALIKHNAHVAAQIALAMSQTPAQADP